MKKILPVLARLSIVACILLLSSTAFGQLTGIKNIPGDYPNVTAAVADLNSQGVGAGGVTFNVAAGFTESTTAQITLTATGTVANPIVFQKGGAGANPIITRTDAGTLTTSSLGAQGDAVFMLSGSDFVTINGIDIQATTSSIEYGIMTDKPNAADGCKNITIQNCVITMTKGTSGFVVGVHISNGPLTTASATGQTIASVAGANENITINGNTIQNVHTPIYVRGGSGSYDQNIIVGQNGAGNILQNFGGGSATTTYGVYFIYANNTSVDYNTINNAAGGGTPHSSTFYGVFYSVVSGIVSGSNNAFTTSVSGTSASYSLYNGNLATTEAFNNNTFASGTFSSTGAHYMIYASNGTTNKTINANSIIGTFARTGAGAIYGYYNFGSPAGGTETLTNNNFSNITNTGTGAIYGIYTFTTTSQNRTCTGNTFNNLTAGTGLVYACYAVSGNNNVVNNNIINNINTSGTVYGIYASGTNLTATNNKISNVSTGGTFYGIYAYGPTSTITNDTIFSITQTAAGTTYGIFVSTSASTLGTVSNCEVRNMVSAGTTLVGIYVGQAAGTVNRNKVFNLTSTSVLAPTVSGIQVYSNGMDVVNNIIGDIKAPAANTASGITPSVRGINITSTSANKNINLYHNSVYLNASSTGANFGSAGVFATNSLTATSARLKMVGNIIVNVSNPNGTGVVSALTRSAVGLANFDVTSNNNLYFAGSPSANKLIFNDGTNLIQTLGGYQTFALSEGSSLSFLPNFLSTVAANANFVHIDPATPTQLESGSINLNIANDYDGDIRALAAGYAGTGTAPDIGADEFNGQTPAPIIVLASVSPAAIGQCAAVSRVVTATVTTLSGTITGATLNYSYNGVAQPGIAMVNTLGNDWTATIPAATPTNAVVTWSVTATNSLPLSSTANGTSYQDDPLLGVTAVAANTVSPICAGATSGVYVTLNYPAGVPPVYTTPTVFSPTSDEDFGNITLIQNGVTVLNNTTALHSLAGTIGTATGTAGGYSDFSSFGPFNFVSGQPVNFSVSSLTSGTAFNNVLKIFIDLNKNGSFADPGECMYFENPSVSGAHTASGSFTIPVSAFGVTRMRVYCQETFTGNNAYTNSFSYGEYEDYTISISNISTVSWSDGISTIGTGTSLSVSPSVTTSYTATVLSSGCNLTSNATTITVNQLPAAPTATNSSQCGIGVPIGSVASAAGANGTGSFYWYNAPANGTTVQTPPLTPIPATSCTYTFNLTDAFGDGWNGATMQILNGAVVVATIGGSFTSGSSATQTVSLQSGVTYTLFWNNAGAYPEEVGISVVNPAGSTIYTMGATFNNPNIGTTMLTIVTDCSAAPPIGFTTGIGYTTFQTSISNTVTYYVSELGTNGCYSALTPITLTVVNPDPITVTPGANTALCLGQNITLNASSNANPAYTFTWDANTYNGSGFNNPLAGAQQTVTPTIDGSYIYTVTGTNGVCTATATVTTAANALPVITSVTGSPAAVCNNDTINLAVSSFVNGPQVLPAGYCATQNAGGSGSMINNVVFNTISNNTSATNPVGAPYYTNTNLTTTVNIGQTYPLTVTIDPLGIYSLTTASVWIDFNRNGVYEVSEWFDAGINIPSGTSNTVNITIPINALPGLTGMRIRTRGNTSNNATYGCTFMGSGETEDYQVNIQAAPANPYTYTWNTIPVSTGANTTTPAINNTASNLVVTYIVTATDNVTGCVNQDTTNNITIYPPILPPTVVNSAHCGIQIPTAVANDVNGFVGPNYNWYATAVNSNALQATAANTYNTLVGNTTTLYVSVEDTLTGCETASTPVTITVAAGPALTLASTLDSICVGNTTAAIGLSAGSASYNTYSWSPAAGVSGNEITGWTFNPAVSTIYTLSASQSAAPNCSNQDTISIQVDQVIPPAPTVAQNSFNVCSGTNSILLGASSPVVNNTFTYTLNFFDSFGDGWNGNTINVNVNGVAVLSGVTLPSGSNGSATFTVNGGQSITTQFNAIGSWISECTYNIVDNNGNVVFSGTPGSASGPPSLTVPYVVPVSPQPNFVINWYNASTNGANVGTGSPLQAVGTTIMPTATNGTYTFYAGLSLGACNSATTVPVTVNVADVAGTLTAVNTCINTTNGTFTASNFTCGTAPFDYSVNNGPYGAIPTNLAAGTYSVIIRDANLLFSPTYTITVGVDSTIPPAPSVPQALYSVCTGVNSVLLAATPPVLQGSQTYTLNFFDSFGDGWNGNTINVLINGIPVLNGVTLPNGSNGTATFTVNNGDVLTTQFNAIGLWIAECTYSITGPGGVLVFSGTPASNVGPPSLINGITISTPPANPQPNYVLNWYNASTNGAFVGTGSPLEAVGTTVMPTAANGTYSFYVGTSLGSCNSSTTTQVTVNVADVAATITPINATCNGVANGSFTATNFTCGTGPFDYSVNNGAFGAIPTNLPAGNHTVVIRDANNLLSTIYNITITQPAWSINAPVAAANGSACYGDTSEIISATSSINGQTATVTQTFTLASNVFFGGGGTQSFTQNISLPAGATVTGTQLSFNNVSTSNFAWPSDFNVSLTGASTLGSTVLAFVNQEVANAGPYLQNPSLLNNNGGNVTVNITNTYPPGTGFFGSVTLIVTYSIPAPAAVMTWWNAPTAGNQVGTGASLESVGTSVLVNTLTPGVYNFYAQGEDGGCVSATRTLVSVTVHALPLVNGGNNTSICIGQSTTLTATGASTYTWNNGVSNGVAFTPNATNNYIVNGIDVNGCANQDTVTVVVNALPIVSAGPNQTVCLNTPVVLSGSGATTYTWTNGVSNNTPFTPVTTNNYVVTGTDGNGCVNTDTATVTVLPLPNVNAGQDFAICVGLGSTLTATGASTYQWNNNVLNGVTFFPNTTTTYTVIGTGANGCSAQDSIVVTVNTTPTISITNGGAACANGNVALNATTTGAFGGFWSSTNGLGTFGPNVSNANVVYNANVNDPGTVTFVYVAFNQCGASNDTTTINILGLPSVNAGVDASVCTGTNTSLTATASGTVVWNNGILDGVAFPAVGGTTNYIATATAVNGCTNTDTVSITGLALPQVNAGSDQTICSGDFVTLNATGAVTYAWSNNVIDGIPFAPAATTTFTVTGTGANGCDNTDNVTVTVNALPNAVAIQADPVTLVATPAGATYQWIDCASGQIVADATNDTLVATANGSYAVIVTNANGCSDTSDCMIVDQVGIYFPESAVIGLYPNPTNGMVTLEIPAQDGATAYVYDAQGKLILTVANAKNGEQFDLSRLTTGVYTFRVTLNNLTHIEKVVKH